MSERGRRVRVRGSVDPKGVVRRGGKTPRSRLGSVSCSNEESTEGEDDTVVRKVSGGVHRIVVAHHPKDSDRGLRMTEGSRGGHTKRRSVKIGLSSSLAEEDVIDGFLFESYSTLEDALSDTKESSDPAPLADVGDMLPDGVQQSEEKKEEEGEIRNGISEHFGEMEPLLPFSKEHNTPDAPLISNGELVKLEEQEVGENNNEPTTPNQNFVVAKPVAAKSLKVEPVHREPLKSKEVNCSDEINKSFNKICDTAEEAKKVPPDLEAPRPETPKQDAIPSKKSPPYPPLKSNHFLPLQNNGPLEPSAAVAAVTVPTSAAPIQTPAPSSTSPAGGVPFPTSLINHQEEQLTASGKPVSPLTSKGYDGSKGYESAIVNSKVYDTVGPKGYDSAIVNSKVYDSTTVSPKVYESAIANSKGYDGAIVNSKGYDGAIVNSKGYDGAIANSKGYDSAIVNSKGYDNAIVNSKGYDSSIKSPRGSSSDVVGSHPHSQYPVCSSYSDYTVSYSYNNNSKQHYQEGGQRTHGSKVVTNNSYYNHHPQQSADSKYSNHKEVRSNSIDNNCDVYENYRYDSKAAELGSYGVGQTYDKSCDPQTISKKSNNANSVYNFKTSQVLTNENISKTGSDKVGGKVTGDLYSNISKAKIPNRTTYYQSIVNKSHSRHKSSRRVLPASAYENKQVINNYSSSKPELVQVPPAKSVQYTPHHYSTDNKKHDYYQTLSSANTGTTNTYNCNTYKSEPPQTHVSNSVGHSNYPTESQSSGTRNYKTNADHSVSSYREKQPLPIVGSAGSKPYSYHNNRNFVDASAKVSTDTAPTFGGNSDYYHKGGASYSRSSGSNPSAISDTNNYKSSNHSGDHSTVYQSKNSSYHPSRTSSEKSGRNYYANQEGSYKSYRQELVPKQNSDDSHGYRNAHEGISYLNHGNSNSSLKLKESITHNAEPTKPVPVEPVRSIPPESNSIHPPPVSENSSHQTTTPRDNKTTFYPYADPSHYNHQRTPPLSSSKAPFEPVTPTKDSEAFRLLTSNSSSAISSYPQRSSATPPPSIPDGSRNGAAKTLWSPTAASAPSTATNREIAAASSRDSHSSHSNSSISSLSQLSQSLGPAPQQSKENIAIPPSAKDPQRSSSSSNGHSRSSSRNETPVTTSSGSSSGAYGVSGSLTSLIFSKASTSSHFSSTVLTSPSSAHFSSGPSPVPSVLPLAPSLPSFGSGAGHHVMFAPPLPPPGSSLSSPSLTPLAANPTGPSPFSGESLFAPPPPPSTDLLNIRRELDTRFLASQDRSIAVPPPPYLRSEMHQHQHQHTHMHQHSPFLPPPPLAMAPTAAQHLYDKFPKVDSSFYGRNALGLPTYPISPLLAPGSATATPTPFAPPGHMAAFQPKISPLVKAKSMKSGRWCAMHVRISWEIYRHQQKQQESQKGGGGKASDMLRPPSHLFGGALPRPHELGFSPSPLMGAAGSIHARSPYDVSPQHPGFLGPTPAHLGISPFSRPNYPSIGIPGNSFAGLGGLGLTGAAGMLGRAGELGPGGYLGMDPWSRLHRTPPTFPSPSGGSWGGLKAEADRMQQKRSEEEKKRTETEKRETEKAKERESKKEHEKQKERDRESRASHIPSHPDPLRNGDSSSSTNNRERDWDRVRERTRESSRSPLRTHKNTSSSSSEDTKDIKVKEEKKEEEQQQHNNNNKDIAAPSLVVERTKTPTHQDLAMDYMTRGGLMPMAALSPSEQARMAALLPPPHPHHFWNHQTMERYRSTLELHQRDMDSREQFMQKYASLQFREAEMIERQLQADRDRQVYERTKQLPNYAPPSAFPHLPPFMGYPPRTKTGSPMNNGGGVPPPLIPCSPTATPPLHMKHAASNSEGASREHYAAASKTTHSSEVESQSR